MELSPVRSRYQKKKCENFEEFTQPPTHTFLCPTYFVYEEFTQPLYSLSSSSLSSSSSPRCITFGVFFCFFALFPSSSFSFASLSDVPFPGYSASACSVFLWFPTFLPLARDHSLELGDATTELVCALVLTRCGSCNLFVQNEIQPSGHHFNVRLTT